MIKVDVVVSVAKDGLYSVYCKDYPAIFGRGDTVEAAVAELKEMLRITRDELGRNSTLFYPEWLDKEYEFVMNWDVQDLLAYYAGVIKPALSGKVLFEGRDFAWRNGIAGLSGSFSAGKVPHPKIRPCRANEQPLLKNQYI